MENVADILSCLTIDYVESSPVVSPASLFCSPIMTSSIHTNLRHLVVNFDRNRSEVVPRQLRVTDD